MSFRISNQLKNFIKSEKVKISHNKMKELFGKNSVVNMGDVNKLSDQLIMDLFSINKKRANDLKNHLSEEIGRKVITVGKATRDIGKIVSNSLGMKSNKDKKIKNLFKDAVKPPPGLENKQVLKNTDKVIGSEETDVISKIASSPLKLVVKDEVVNGLNQESNVIFQVRSVVVKDKKGNEGLLHALPKFSGQYDKLKVKISKDDKKIDIVKLLNKKSKGSIIKFLLEGRPKRNFSKS